jgi:hypothetical protein
MFTKLVNQTTAAADKATPQVIFEVGQLNPCVNKAKVKEIIVSAVTPSPVSGNGESTDRKLYLQAVANDGTITNIAQQDKFQINTAGAFLFDQELWLSQDQRNNSIRKLQIAIENMTDGTSYASTAVVNYE